MRAFVLAAAFGGVLSACASNKASEDTGMRVRDTTLTSRDTTNPNDTLTHIRDTMPDTTGRRQ